MPVCIICYRDNPNEKGIERKKLGIITDDDVENNIESYMILKRVAEETDLIIDIRSLKDTKWAFLMKNVIMSVFQKMIFWNKKNS